MKNAEYEQLGTQAGSSLLNRRELLARVGWLCAGIGCGLFPPKLRAGTPATLDVAYAGSMGSLMEGPLKQAAAQSLNLELHGRAQGANALAQLIVSGSIRPDVFISITPGPMLDVLRSGKAEAAQPVARTEMVIAYNPRSRFAPELDAAAAGKAKWWKILQEPGFRFGRSDPSLDPQGRNIVFVMMLAAKEYKQADLAIRILGPLINRQQISMESGVQARLQAGELDAGSAYKIQPAPFHLPYLTLPKEINLSGSNIHADHPDVSFSIGGKTYFPEPLVYYAAVLKEARNIKGANAFVEWLKGNEAQAIMRQNKYDPPISAAALRA